MAKMRDMTTGTPLRLILVFSLPIIAGNIFQQMYSIVDTLIIGRLLGVKALAAVSSAGWLYWMVISMVVGLAQGFSIDMAHRFGAGDQQGMHHTAMQSYLVGAAATVIMEIVAGLSLHGILQLMQTPADTFDLTERYLRVIFTGSILPCMVYNVCSGFLRSVGNSRIPFVAVSAGTVVNIALDILFVGPLNWSVEGAAWATVLSQVVSAVIAALALLRIPQMRPHHGDLRPDRVKCLELVKLGVPVSCQDAIISVGGLVLQTVVNMQGFVFLAGYSAASRLQGLIEVTGISLAAAMNSFAGQNIGANRTDRVRLGLRHTVMIGIGLVLLVCLVLILFGRDLLMLFIEDDAALVEQVLAFGSRFLIVMSIGLPGLYLLFIYRSTLQGVGDTFTPMLSGILELVMRVSCALILPRFFGEWGVYCSQIMAWISAAVFLMAGYYRRMRIIEQRLKHT